MVVALTILLRIVPPSLPPSLPGHQLGQQSLLLLLLDLFLHSAFIDCSASSYAFINKDFIRYPQLPVYTPMTPRTLEVIDGRPIKSGTITHITKFKLL